MGVCHGRKDSRAEMFFFSQVFVSVLLCKINTVLRAIRELMIYSLGPAAQLTLQASKAQIHT